MRAVLFKTRHRHDETTLKLQVNVISSLVDRCLMCEENAAYALVYEPFEGSYHDEIIYGPDGEGKSPTFGFGLCGEHMWFYNNSKEDGKEIMQTAVDEAWKAAHQQEENNRD